MSNEVTEGLKPCPWCTTPPEVVKGAGYGFSVECVNETCQVGPSLNLTRGRANAITAWNTRAVAPTDQPPAPVTDYTEAARELVRQLNGDIKECEVAEIHAFDVINSFIASLVSEAVRERDKTIAEYGGQRCTNVCAPFKTCAVAHWCLLAQDHEGDHVHICEVNDLRAALAEKEQQLEAANRSIAKWQGHLIAQQQEIERFRAELAAAQQENERLKARVPPQNR